jgi:hypothetical protein
MVKRVRRECYRWKKKTYYQERVSLVTIILSDYLREEEKESWWEKEDYLFIIKRCSRHSFLKTLKP